ncbi:MAG: sigma-70 family RNA polymerase sigma factor [Cyclobacteriaceae bacterium]|nr:sigma-70 family RNA polymerase sigma factor [Cyclobacteriaceae bacterium]
MDENLLWQRFKNDDLKAFEEIYREHTGKLFTYGMTVLRNRAIVKDAIHELFLDLWQHRKNLSADIHLQYYLFKGLRRKILYLIKDKNSQCFNLEESFEKIEQLNHLSIESEWIKEQSEEFLRKQFSNAFKSLPPRQKEVLQLLYMQNLSNDEVARIMEINIESVYTLNWKALRNLRQQFEGLKARMVLSLSILMIFILVF